MPGYLSNNSFDVCLYIEPCSSVGEGTIIMHMAMVNSGAIIGANCIINSMALVEHDVVIGNNVHVATGLN